MAVSHVIAQESHTGTTGSVSQASFDWSVSFASGRRGLVVWVFALSASDFATSVKIDPAGANTDVPAVSGGFAADTTGEPRSVKTFFLGTGLPTATATVRVNRTNNATVMYAVSTLVSAATDTEIYLPGIVLVEGDGTLTVQPVDDGSTGVNSVRYAAAASALASVPGPGSGSTALVAIDLGSDVFATVRETAAGQGVRNVGFSSGTSDDRAAVHLAVREVFADLPNEGTADGGIGWAGSTTGITDRSGEPTGSVVWAGSATGATIHAGAATGTLGWAGAATGSADHEGVSTGSTTWSGTATGESPGIGAQEGSALGSITWAGTTTGTAAHEGSVTGILEWAGTADGVAVHAGAAAGSVGWVGEATSIVGPPPRQRLEASGLGVGWEGSPISTGLEGSSI